MFFQYYVTHSLTYNCETNKHANFRLGAHLALVQARISFLQIFDL